MTDAELAHALEGWASRRARVEADVGAGLSDGTGWLREAAHRLRANEADQQDAARWRHFASSPQTALMLGSKRDPNDTDIFWDQECNALADAAMRRLHQWGQ